MIAKCARCQYVFSTDRYGKQHCPSCNAELMLNAPPGAAPAAAQPVAPAAAPGTGPVPPAGPEATACCVGHPARPASATCPRCGAFACAECLQPGPDGLGLCLACRARAASEPDEPTAWEEREKHGLFAAFFGTLKRSFVDPVRFFERMRVKGAAGALSFYWINAAIGVLGGQFWQAVLASTGLGKALNQTPELPPGHPLEGLMQLQSDPVTNIVMGVVWAVFAPVSLYLTAGIFHLGLLLFKGARNGFDATLRSVAYSSGPNLLQLVPLCGGFIGGLWVLVLTVIGLWKTQRTSLGVAIAAVLVPMFVLFCCTCMGLVAVAFAGGAALAGAMK